MIKVQVEHMQGAACGLKCIKVYDVSTSDKMTVNTVVGFIIPIPYMYKGYWGGTHYLVDSFPAIYTDEEKCSELCSTISDVCDHLHVEVNDFFDALVAEKLWDEWEKINTIFWKGNNYEHTTA